MKQCPVTIPEAGFIAGLSGAVVWPIAAHDSRAIATVIFCRVLAAVWGRPPAISPFDALSRERVLVQNSIQVGCCRDREEADNVKILVVDDHPLIRSAMRDVLKLVEGDATVLEASTCSQAMEVIAEHPDLELILLDLNLPDRDGFAVLTELGERYPAIPVAVLSAQQDRHSIERALDLGALGFITKSGQLEVMVKALEIMLAGSVYIPPEIRARDQPLARQPDEKQPANRPSPADLGLTDRQVEVLSLMVQAKSNKAICRILNLAEPTVKNHVTAILKALKVSSRMEALIAVRELGWKLPPVSKS